MVAAYIAKQEEAKKEKYQRALSSINEAHDTIAGYRAQVDDLTPQKTAAQDVVQNHVEFVEGHRLKYIDVSPSEYRE